MRVLNGSLLTVLSPEGELMNQAELGIETLQRGSVTLTLPEKSRLFGVLVNEESALVVQDGDSYRFQVTGDAAGVNKDLAMVRFTYATSLDGLNMKNLKLQAFKIGEPLEDYRGGFRCRKVMSWLTRLEILITKRPANLASCPGSNTGPW